MSFYRQAIFVDGNLLNQVTATDTDLLFRQQMMHNNIRQMFPVKLILFNIVLEDFFSLISTLYLKAYRSL